MTNHSIVELSAGTLLAVLLSVSPILCGCSKSDPIAATDSVGGAQENDTDSIRSAADIAASGVEPAIGSDSFTASTTPTPDGARRPDDPLSQREPAARGANAPMPRNAPNSFPLAESTPAPVGVPDSSAARTLRNNLTAAELSQALETADRDMQSLASGRLQIQDPEEAGKMMLTVAKIKLQAAIQLERHPDATDKQRIEGMRGHLQSLSHLAAMGDLDSAKALENLANENLKSDEPTIAGDSRIILIGFAIEALQAGRESASNVIVKLVQGMQENPNSDVPAVLVMARARQVLASYGLVDEAASVREKILALYGNSSDAMIAQVAAEAAGTAKFDATRRLLSAILNQNNVPLSKWTDSVTELIADSPDMNTVQFLASSALQLEAAGRNAFVEETFSILSEDFAEKDAATTMEVETARLAMEARRDVIGSPMGFENLPTVGGRGVSPSDYNGKVVLMPFWAISVPESLQLVKMLKEIRDANPDKVSIVGMNLDPEQAPLSEFLAENPLDFPSYRSVSSATARVANPVAARFGLVSMPFVAVFNQDGKVEALDFTGNQLQSIVDRLVKNE